MGSYAMGQTTSGPVPAYASAPAKNGASSLPGPGMSEPQLTQRAAALQSQPPAVESAFINLNPAWSPDGRQLVFESWRSGAGELYTLDADGTNERRVPTGGGNSTHPHWAPDGRIVFDSDRGGFFTLYTVRPDGTDERLLLPRGRDTTAYFARHPAWSPDGRYVAFDSGRDSNGEIYVARADGSGTRRITALPGNNSHASWAPSGEVIHEGTIDGQPGPWAVHPETGARRRLFARPEPYGYVEVAPDGRRFIYGTKGRLFVAPVDGPGQPIPLTEPGFISYEAAWSPDSRRIAFYTDITGRHELYLIDADGMNLRQLTGLAPSAQADAGAARPNPAASAKDGQKVPAAATPRKRARRQ
ncbi:TolB family protein [Solirubrum puertoriconensis]|nr:PD40 domain-containing protein [Solirubrum puertoriconensis]